LHWLAETFGADWATPLVVSDATRGSASDRQVPTGPATR